MSDKKAGIVTIDEPIREYVKWDTLLPDWVKERFADKVQEAIANHYIDTGKYPTQVLLSPIDYDRFRREVASAMGPAIQIEVKDLDGLTVRYMDCEVRIIGLGEVIVV